VHAVNKTVAIPNGSGTIRLRYKATNEAQRARLFATGSYAYYQTDDVEVIANNSAVAITDLVIAIYAGAGTNLVITPTKTKWQQRDEAITTAISAEVTVHTNADTALQAAIDTKPDVDVDLLHL
jgi:hypothetical protein